MFSISNGKSQSTLFAFSVLIIGILCQSYWSWQANRPVQNEDGIFNYSLAYMPSSYTEVTYIENKATTALVRYLQKKLEGALQYFFSEYHKMDFLNARKADLDYHVSGFSLIESPIEELDWSVKENRQKFFRALEPVIRELHPDVDEIAWYDDFFLQRFVDGGNPPAIDAPHLDFHVDQTLTKAWVGQDMTVFDMILGIWKPDNMDSPVVDYPLAFMDATTLDPKDAIPLFGDVEQTKMDQTVHRIKFTSSSMKYNSKQKWYYYPNQTSDEVLIFRQYTNENTLGTFANPHTSFKVPEFPADAPSRRSVEMRVGITFKKNDAKTSS